MAVIPPCCCGHLRQLFSNHSYSAGGEGNSGDTEEKRKEYKSLCGRSHRCILDGCRLEKCIRFSVLLFLVSSPFCLLSWLKLLAPCAETSLDEQQYHLAWWYRDNDLMDYDRNPDLLVAQTNLFLFFIGHCPSTCFMLFYIFGYTAELSWAPLDKALQSLLGRKRHEPPSSLPLPLQSSFLFLFLSIN